MANRTNFTAEKRQRFLEVIAETANVTRAAAEAGVSRRGAYDARDADETFKAAWDKAVERGVAAMEDEATRRAVEGWDEPVFYKGEPTGVVRKFSDTLLMFRLKAQRPDKYRDNHTMGIDPNANTFNVQISFADPPPR